MKRIAFLTILIVSLLIINNLIQSIYTFWQKQTLIGRAEEALEKEKIEHLRLKQAIALAKTEAFVEEQARNKLLMVKPKEHDVLLPKPTSLPRVARQEKPKSHWQEWLDLFF